MQVIRTNNALIAKELKILDVWFGSRVSVCSLGFGFQGNALKLQPYPLNPQALKTSGILRQALTGGGREFLRNAQRMQAQCFLLD